VKCVTITQLRLYENVVFNSWQADKQTYSLTPYCVEKRASPHLRYSLVGLHRRVPERTSSVASGASAPQVFLTEDKTALTWHCSLRQNGKLCRVLLRAAAAGTHSECLVALLRWQLWVLLRHPLCTLLSRALLRHISITDYSLSVLR